MFDASAMLAFPDDCDVDVVLKEGSKHRTRQPKTRRCPFRRACTGSSWISVAVVV